MVLSCKKSFHRGSTGSGSRNCSSCVQLMSLCSLSSGRHMECLHLFLFQWSSLHIAQNSYQKLIDQTRPAFTTPVESISRKEVPGQRVFAQQASWPNQILSEQSKYKVDFLFLGTSNLLFYPLKSIFIMYTYKKKK